MRIRYDNGNDTTQHDTIRWLMRRYDTMRIRYGYEADAMRHDAIYDIRYGYGTDTMRHDAIHWFVIMLAPYRLSGFVSLSSVLITLTVYISRSKFV